MANKKKFRKQVQTAIQEKRRPDKKPPQRRVSKPKTTADVRWMIPVILAITFVAFIPVLRAGFVSWDDGEYVLQNVALKNGDLKTVLATPMQGNFHPQGSTKRDRARELGDRNWRLRALGRVDAFEVECSADRRTG